MTDNKIKEFRDDIKRTRNKDQVATLRSMVNLADYLKGFKMFNQAFNEYKHAIEYAKKVPDNHSKKAQLLYEADNGYLSVLCEIDKDQLSETLNAFMTKYPVMTEQTDMIKRQDASHLIGYCKFEMKEYDQARIYLTLSFNLLEQLQSQLQPSSKDYKKKYEDYELRLADLYRTFIKVALAEKKYKEVKEFYEKAFQCQGVQKNVELFYFLLDVKRSYTPLKGRLEISQQMHSLWSKNKKHKLKDYELNVHYCLFHDYLVHKNYENAEQQLWLAYKEKEAIKNDEENCVAKDLVEWYKLSKRLQDNAKAYEKIAHGLCNLKAFELAYFYYDKLLQATPSENLLKKKSIHEALLKCLNYFPRSQEYYLKCFQKFDDLYQISQTLRISPLTDVRLDLAISMQKLDICSFEEKQKILMLLEQDLEDDKQLVKFYAAFISLLKDYPDKESVKNIAEMEEKRKLCQQRLIDVVESDVEYAASDFFDEYDQVDDDEVLQVLNAKWQKHEKVEALKKKMKEKNRFGENGLHQAIEKKKFEDVKFLLEECGYMQIINEQDGAGRTPLFLAVMFGKNEIVEYLIRFGASVDISTNDKGSKYPAGRTVLMEASTLRNTTIVRLLLSNNANPLVKDFKGKLASDYLKDEIANCESTLNNSGGSVTDDEDKIGVVCNDLKETLKLMKKAEEEKEKRDKENQQESLNVNRRKRTRSNQPSEASGSRKRSNPFKRS